MSAPSWARPAKPSSLMTHKAARPSLAPMAAPNLPKSRWPKAGKPKANAPGQRSRSSHHSQCQQQPAQGSTPAKIAPNWQNQRLRPNASWQSSICANPKPQGKRRVSARKSRAGASPLRLGTICNFRATKRGQSITSACRPIVRGLGQTQQRRGGKCAFSSPMTTVSTPPASPS